MYGVESFKTIVIPQFKCPNVLPFYDDKENCRNESVDRI